MIGFTRAVQKVQTKRVELQELLNTIWKTQGLTSDTVNLSIVPNEGQKGGWYHNGSITLREWIMFSDVELYTEYYIYHEIAHAINDTQNGQQGHSEDFQAIFESITKDAIAIGDLPTKALELFSTYESDYALNGGGYGFKMDFAGVEFINEMIKEIEIITTDTDSSTLETLSDINNLSESLVFEKATNSLIEQALNTIKISDVVDILRHIVGLEEFKSDKNGDLNGDNIVDINDAITGLRLIVDLTDGATVMNGWDAVQVDIL